MKKVCHLTVKDEVWCYFTGLDAPHVDFLFKEFGIFVDGYFFMPLYKLGRWDGKIHFFEKTGKTYVRLLDQILPHIEKWGYDVNLVDNRPIIKSPTVPGQLVEFDPNGICTKAQGTDIMGLVEIKPGVIFNLRPYQLECVKRAVDAGSGFIIAGTGAGKTSITAGISHVYGELGYKVITIVPSSDLVDQTASWYEQLGMDVGVYSGTDKNIEATHVVATWQALQYNPSIMEHFNVLIWDEAHGIKASVAQKLINEHGKHIAFRFGVTGTLPKAQADQMTLFSSIGPVLKEIPAKWLMDNGFLATVEIHPVELDETYIDEEFPDYSAERAFLTKSPARMEKIADIIISQCADKGNTLVLVNSIPFGEKLARLIKGAVFLYGASPKDLRKEHYDMFEQNDDLIVIASSGIASTGISIDRVFCLVMVDAGKSFIRAIQSIGRGLRMADDKKELTAIDIYSKLKWSKKHAKERDKYYKEAQYPICKKISMKVKQ